MGNYRYVNSREQLKSALSDKVDYIVINDSNLAKKIRITKTASKTALATAITAATVGVVNAWNPIGWGTMLLATAVSASLSGAVIFLIFILGVTLLYALYNNYTIKIKATVKLPNGTEISGEMILERDK